MWEWESVGLCAIFSGNTSEFRVRLCVISCGLCTIISTSRGEQIISVEVQTFERPYITMCLNSMVYEIFDKLPNVTNMINCLITHKLVN